MNSRERVEAALAHQHPDQVPVGAWSHAYSEEWSPQALAEVTIGRAKRLAWDYVKFQPRMSCFAEAFGAEWRPSGNAQEHPVPVRDVVTDLESWKRLPEVDATVRPLADQVESLRMVVDDLGPAIPVIQTVFSPVTVASYLIDAPGKESADRRLKSDLVEHPEVVGTALAQIAATLIDFSLRSIEAGAAGIFFAISGYASRDLMSRSDYEELALPHDLTVLSELPKTAWFNVAHLCGARLHFEIASLLPVQAISWSIHDAGNPGLKEGRARADKAVMGGISQATLLDGSPEAVMREAEHAISATDGRGLLLAPGCSVAPQAPERNLRAMTQALAV